MIKRLRKGEGHENNKKSGKSNFKNIKLLSAASGHGRASDHAPGSLDDLYRGHHRGKF